MSIVRDTAENPSSEKVRLGAGCRVNPPPPVVGEIFSLDFPFHRITRSPDHARSPDYPISFVSFVVHGFAFPIPAMTRDSGDSGDHQFDPRLSAISFCGFLRVPSCPLWSMVLVFWDEVRCSFSNAIF
jgi:hypothetical protein